MDQIHTPQIIAFIRHMLRPFIWLVAGHALVALLFAIDLSVKPYLVKLILNKLAIIAPSDAWPELRFLVTVYMVIAIILFFVSRFRDWLWLWLGPCLKKHVGLYLMECMMAQPHQFFQHHFSGSLANKINDIIDGVPTMTKIFIDEFFRNFIAVIVAIYTVSLVGWHFALGLVVWVTVFLFISIVWSLHGAQLATQTAEKKSITVGYIVDILANMMSVRLFGTKKFEHARVDAAFQDFVIATQERNWFYMRIYTCQGLTFILFQALCFWLLVNGFQAGTITAGDFALILSINFGLLGSLWNISKDVRDFSESYGNVAQGLRILSLNKDSGDVSLQQSLVVSEGEIVFDHVAFNYGGAEPFFQNKTIIVRGGEKIGVVGASGSGKSTFVNLILRLFDVSSGRILIDGQDIAVVTHGSLTDAIGVIPQEPLLFHRTIMENIRYGKLTATDQEVIEAAKKAHAHDFIMQYPGQYNAIVGERGAKLSGGQRQRIIIARLILKDPIIIILDEATSQLDTITENKLQESLLILVKHKTTIVIAHRLSTLLTMDRILVFEHGHVVQDGTHDELIAMPGLYAALWQAQCH